MISASECLLKANNLEIAAKSASSDNRMLYLQAAAEWRRRAHDLLMRQTDPSMEQLGFGQSRGGEAASRRPSGDEASN